MTRHRLLTRDELRQCFAEPMRNMTAAPDAAADIWPYVDALDLTRLGITEIGDVVQVYRDGRLRYDQVHLRTDAANKFMVVVVDLQAEVVLGHHLLDLNIGS